MDRCIGCHSCSLACARLIHKRLSWSASGIRIHSTGGLSTGFYRRSLSGMRSCALCTSVSDRRPEPTKGRRGGCAEKALHLSAVTVCKPVRWTPYTRMMPERSLSVFIVGDVWNSALMTALSFRMSMRSARCCCNEGLFQNSGNRPGKREKPH